MKFLQLLSLTLFVNVATSSPVNITKDAPVEDTLLKRPVRDRDGKYHPEHGSHAHRHEHNHAHAVSVAGPDGIGSLINVNGFEISNFRPGTGSKLPVTGLLGIPPPPPPPPSIPPVGSPPTGTGSMAGPNGYANCGCVVFGQCAPEVVVKMPALLSTLKNDVVCGYKYSLCCLEDPWAGPVDQWADQVPCQAEEVCVRKYGDSPYDIQNYGVIGPCLGLGSVRCLDNKPPTVIIPIIDQPPTNPPIYIPPPPTSPPVYVPPPVTEPPTSPPVYVPPPVTEPPTSPPVYIPPPPVTEPPTLPPTVYEPPVETYVPPVETPVVTYEPPVEEPVVTYEPPVEEPVVTYEPPVEETVVTYEPPVEEPVVTYEPPVETYEPPVATYEPSVETPEPPPTYGVPVVGTGIARYPYRRYPGYYGGGFGGYGGYGGYPGFGFRKRFHVSKGFWG